MLDGRRRRQGGASESNHQSSLLPSMAVGCSGDTCAFSLLPGEFLVDGDDDQNQRGDANQNQQQIVIGEISCRELILDPGGA